MNFCDKCNKIVPDSEVLDLNSKFLLNADIAGIKLLIPNILENNTSNNKIHRYTTVKNGYGNTLSEIFGYYPVEKQIICGNIIEPSPEEYYIYCWNDC